MSRAGVHAHIKLLHPRTSYTTHTTNNTHTQKHTNTSPTTHTSACATAAHCTHGDKVHASQHATQPQQRVARRIVTQTQHPRWEGATMKGTRPHITHTCSQLCTDYRRRRTGRGRAARTSSKQWMSLAASARSPLYLADSRSRHLTMSSSARCGGIAGEGMHTQEQREEGAAPCQPRAGRRRLGGRHRTR